MTAPVRTIAAKFTADGSEVVQAALAKVTAAAQSAAQKIAQTAQVQAVSWQRSVQAAERAAYAVEAAQTRTARAVVSSATATSKAVSDKYGMVALSVASSFNQMTFSGKVTGAAVRNIFIQTATVAATVFGVGGPVVAAIAVTALSLTNMFSGARAESAQLQADWEKQLRVMAARGDYAGAGRTVSDVLAGDPASDDPNEQMGLLRLRDRVRAARARQSTLPSTAGTTLQERIASGREQETTSTNALEAALAKLETRYVSMQKTFDSLSARETSRLAALKALEFEGETEAERLARYAIEARVAARASQAADAARAARDPNRFASAPLDAQVDTSLGLAGGRGVIQPLGDPKKFAAQLTADVAESFRHFKLPPMPPQVEWADAFSTSISMTLIDGFSAGLERAFASGSIGDGFKALTATLLSGLGGAMVEFGKKALLTAKLMEAIKIGLERFLPGGSTVAALAMIAAGSAMRGAASRAFSGMGGGGGYGGGSGSYAGAAAAASSASVTRLVFGNNSISTAAGMTPRTATQITVIGPDDPRAQRAIVDILRKAEGRGMG